MNRRLLLALFFLVPSLAGCTPPGPREFYRSALQARSEFVDSLSRVVDEKTAKDKYKVSEKLFNDRLLDIKEGLERAKFDGNFNKLSRENFALKNIEPGDRDGMIDGMKSYAGYCENIVFTNVRLKREIDRLKMVRTIETLAKAKSQAESNQPVSVNEANDCPNLSEALTSLEKLNAVNLRFVPQGLTVKQLKLLNPGIPDDKLELILEFDPQKLDDKKDGRFKPPPLPDWPEWAKAIAPRAKVTLTQPAAAKR